MPDVVIMDAQMPKMDGAEATRHVKASFSDKGVLCFTATPDHKEESITSGADAFLIKDCGSDELIAKIAETAHEAETAAKARAQRSAVVLRDVQGLTNEEAAEVLSLTVVNLKSRLHRGRVLLREYLKGHLA